MRMPSVFIGSSKGGLEFARTIRTLLSDTAQIKLWNEGVFDIGKTAIEALVAALPGFDFAILLFTPDDRFGEGEAELFSPRDNVIFELGLFIGQIGRERTFIVQQAAVPLKIPSDLFGVTTARYDWPHGSEAKTLGDYASALGPACDQIRWSIRALGPRKMNKLAAELETVKDRQERQEDILRQLVAFSIAGVIYDHLKNIYFAQREKRPLVYQHIGQTVKRELQFLMDNGCIRHVKLDEVKSGDDLAQKITLTPAGVWRVELREEMRGHPVGG